MGKPKRNQSSLRTGLLGIAMVTAAFFYFEGDTEVIRHWSRRVVLGDAKRTEQRLAVAQTLGPNGVPLLVAGLSSDSDRVVQASHRGLEELLKAWRYLPPEEAARGVMAMSRELARQAKDFSPAGRASAEDLVRRLIIWPVPQTIGDRSQILVYCDRALRQMKPLKKSEVVRLAKASEQRRQTPRTEPVSANRAERDTATQPASEEAAGGEQALSASELFPSWMELPGGSLPWDPAAVAPLPPLPSPLPHLRPTKGGEPAKLQPPPSSRPPELVPPPSAQPLSSSSRRF